MKLCPKDGEKHPKKANYCTVCSTCLDDENTLNKVALLSNHLKKHVNDSKAKYCMYCGISLVSRLENYPNSGDYYYGGDINNGKPNGKGVIIYSNKDFEEGNFVDGKLQGFGTKYFAERKCKYTGEYANGKRTGKGRIECLENGCVQEGEWDNDYGVFDGTCTHPNGKVEKIEIKEAILFHSYKDLHKCLTQDHSPEDLSNAVTVFINKTNTEKNKIHNDDKLIMALIEYLYKESPKEEQNLFMVVKLINDGIKKEGQEEYKSILDRIFLLLEKKDANHIALKHYIDFFDAADEMSNSIKKSNSIIESCRRRFSAIGSADNLFEYVNDKTDIDVLAKLIMLSFGDNSNKSDTEKLSNYLSVLYDNSQKNRETVRASNLNINKVEVDNLKSFYSKTPILVNAQCIDKEDGSFYMGEIKDGKMHGQGEYHWADGGWYKGTWEKDQMHGQGERHWSNGEWCKGTWKKDQMHGQFEYYNADGRVSINNYVNGENICRIEPLDL